MTWIVGTPVMMSGYGFAVSDVRVTWGTKWLDCLQKIYQVGRFVALGFSGSVEIGFSMVDELKRLLHCSDENRAWDPKAIAEWWPQDARIIFNRFPNQLKEHRCELMLLAAHPYEQNGQYSVPYVYKFCSPDFMPRMANPHELISIGSGSKCSTYENLLNTLSTDRKYKTRLFQAEVGTRGGTGSRIGNMITDLLQKHLELGISKHLHYCWVELGSITINTNNRLTSGNWTVSPHGMNSPEITNTDEGNYLAMPKLATSWDELESIARNEGISSGLVAVA